MLNTAMPADPAISIVIPCYGRQAKLVTTVRSVLNQTIGDFEIILVDDGSPEDPFGELQQAIQDSRIVYLHSAQNQGPSAARNIGIKAARGAYVAFLDSDDDWIPTKLALQLAAAQASASPDRFFCVCQTQYLEPDRIRVLPDRAKRPDELWEDYIYVSGNSAQISSFFMSRSLARENLFRENLRLFEDHLFFIEVGRASGDYTMIHQPLSIYDRRTGGGLSYAKSREKCFVYKAAIEQAHFSRAAIAAFEGRYMARVLLATAPIAATALVLRTSLTGAVKPRYIATFGLALIRQLLGIAKPF